MKQRISLWWEALIGGILTLLGFSGCNAIHNIVDPPAEYIQAKLQTTSGNQAIADWLRTQAVASLYGIPCRTSAE